MGDLSGLEAKHYEVFKKNYLVSGLPDEAVREIAELGEYRQEKEGRHLITLGSKSSDLFVILEGKVSIISQSGERLGVIGPGSVLGEVALVDAQPRSATGICEGDVCCAQLPANTLRSYMAKNQNHGFLMLSNLARVLSGRLRNTNVAMEDLKAKHQGHWPKK